MPKSKLNVRFLLLFLGAIVVAGALAGGIWYYQNRIGPARNFAAGERFAKEGEYKKAVSMFGRAVSKQPTNVQYLEAYDNAISHYVPGSIDEARELYNQLIGVRLQRGRATPGEAAPWMRAMETLYERNNVSNVDVLWREFVTEAENVSARLRPDDPAQNRLKYWQAIGTLRRGNVITPEERASAEKMLREVVATDPKFEAAWLDLLRSEYARLERSIGEQREADARAQLAEMDQTIAAVRSTLPDSYIWRLAGVMRERAREDMRDKTFDPAVLERARGELAQAGETVIADREKLLQVVSELLNARSNEWLDRVISLLQDRVQAHPDDMVARKLLMLAATQRNPDLARKIAEESRSMKNVPVSLEALVQEDTRMYAVITLFNSAFEAWRAEKDAAKRTEIATRLLAMRDDAVKYLEPIGERNTARLIQAKAAIVEDRVADAVALFDGLLKGQTAPPPDAYLYAAFANLARREPGSAMRVATDGIERYPAYTPLLTMRGEIEAATGRYDVAERTYRRVLEIDPANALAKQRIAELGGMEVTAAGAANANKGDAVATLLGKTEGKLLARDLDGAEADLLEGYKTIKTDPKDVRLIAALAQFYVLVRDDPAKGKEWIERGLAVQPEDERLLQFKAVMSSKDPVDRVLEGIRLQYPEPNAQAVYRYLGLLDVAQRLADAVAQGTVGAEALESVTKSRDRARQMLPEALDAALKADPRSEMLIEQAALDAMNRQQWDEVERIARVSEGVGERGVAATMRARALMKQDKRAEAIALLQKTRDSGDASPLLLRQLSVLLEATGRLDEATEAIRAAYERRPNDINTARVYALILDRGGERTRALDILRELARANPTNRETMDAWLRIESEVGDRTGAVAMRRRLYRDSPGFRANALALATLLLDAPSDLALMIDDEGKRKFTVDKLQGMTPLKRQQELQQAAQANLNLGLEIVRLLQKQSPGDATLALMKARAMGRFGKVKDGEESLRADIAAAPAADRRMLWIGLGAYLAEAGLPERSAEPFAEAVKMQGKDEHDAEIQIADFWFSRQQWQRARAALEPVVQAITGERQAGLALRLAEICQNLRDHEAATRYADIAEKSLGKTNGTIEMLRGGTLVGRGDAAMAAGDAAKGNADYAKAIETFRKATELAPNNPVAWASLADAERGMFLRTRDPARLSAAETAVDRSLAILSTYLPALRAKKDILLDRNDLPGAIALIEKYVRSSPQNQDGRRLLIDLLMRADNATRAIALAEEGAQQEPRNPEWAGTIGNIQLSVGKEKEASEAFERAFATDSTEETLLRAVNARLLRKEPDWAGAVNLLRSNPKLVAESIALQASLGSALVNAKQRDAGLQALRNTFNSVRDGVDRKTLRPETWEIWYAAVGQAFPDRPKEAEAFAKSTLGGRAPDFYGNRGLARIWRGAGKEGLDAALAYLAEAVKVAKDSPDLASMASIEAGEMAYLAGDCQRSLPLFEQAIAIRPNFAPALNNAAFVTAKCGSSPDKAIAWARQAVEIAPQVADLQDTLGFVLMKSGKAQEALEPLQRAVTMSPTVTPLLHLAEALALAGRKDEARKTLERLQTQKLNAEQIADRDRVEKSLQ